VNYFGRGAIIEGGIHGQMNQNDWMGGHSLFLEETKKFNAELIKFAGE